ncbi:MAG: S1 RNA-binding domain-containing protein, partial [Planctomycetes bacterium]|nr:S1 RNA-binding domain-containing protein [Planctomycetota bacterium]
TALQMDIKIGGVTVDLMRTALEQARRGRIHVLQEMLKVLPRPRAEISPYAPAMERLKINPEKIGMLIGPSGKNIRKLQQDFHCVINVEDDGTVQVSSVDRAAVMECRALIEAQTAEVEKGRTYSGRVTSIKDFGAFVEILPGQEGLLHISEISTGYVERVGDHVRVGDEVTVKVLDVDAQGRIRLSRKALMEGGETGEAQGPAEGPSADDGDSGHRPSRGRGRREGARHGR